MIIAFDLDGTILKNDKTVSAYSLKVLRLLFAQGHYLVPCTGRSYGGMPDYFHDKQLFRYSVVSTGTLVYDGLEDKYIKEVCFTPDEFVSIIDFFEQYTEVDIDYMIKGDAFSDRYSLEHLDDYHIEPPIKKMMLETRTPIDGSVRDDIINHQRYVNRANVLFKVMAERDELLARRNELPFYFTSSLPNNGEITPDFTNKESGLMALCDYLDQPYANVIFFGDSYNDEAALASRYFHSVIMKNGREGLKNTTPFMTEYTNEEDGVCRYLTKFFNL